MNKLPRPSGMAQRDTRFAGLKRNLRLLDLDALPDWPTITPQTFCCNDSIRNQRSRVRCAEWVLYKLFEIYNPEDTRKYLEPFFPAFELLQSQKLHAAFLRNLTELKKCGLLENEIILRKTMLDDCKGDKFEELLFALSIVVLKKRAANDRSDGSIAKNLFLEDSIASANPEIIPSLVLAYKSSLSAQLREREGSKRKCLDFETLLVSKKSEINQRAEESGRKWRGCSQKDLSKRSTLRLTNFLESNWRGNSEWVDLLIGGDRHQPENGLLERPFEDIWPHVRADTVREVRPDLKESLLQNLEKRVVEQDARLQKWKKIQEDLVGKSGVTSAAEGQNIPKRVSNDTQKVDLSPSTNDESPSSPTSWGRDPSDISLPSPETQSLELTREKSSKYPSDRILPDSQKAEVYNISPIKKDTSECENNPIPQQQSYPPIPLPLPKPTSPPSKPPPSLLERTRISMALSSPLKTPIPPPPSPTANPGNPSHPHPHPHPPPPPINSSPLTTTTTTTSTTTLLDRTRHSMSLMSKPSSRKSLKPRRPSKIYPTNPFQASSSRTEPAIYEEREDGDGEDREQGILRDLDADADEEAIFQSRPKIGAGFLPASVGVGVAVDADKNEKYRIRDEEQRS